MRCVSTRRGALCKRSELFHASEGEAGEGLEPKATVPWKHGEGTRSPQRALGASLSAVSATARHSQHSANTGTHTGRQGRNQFGILNIHPSLTI